MDEMAKRTEVRRCDLAREFLPTFGNGDDAILAATLLVTALDYRFPAPISEENRPRYLAALERLPKGSAAKLRVSHVCPYGEAAERQWRVTFTDGSTDYKGLRRFLTKAEADTYATDFLARLRGETNRP